MDERADGGETTTKIQIGTICIALLGILDGGWETTTANQQKEWPSSLVQRGDWNVANVGQIKLWGSTPRRLALQGILMERQN